MMYNVSGGITLYDPPFSMTPLFFGIWDFSFVPYPKTCMTPPYFQQIFAEGGVIQRDIPWYENPMKAISFTLAALLLIPW